VTADSLTARRVPAGISKSKLKKVFEKLDADGSGELDKEVLSVYTHTYSCSCGGNLMSVCQTSAHVSWLYWYISTNTDT
jgi:hypothetical protein